MWEDHLPYLGFLKIYQVAVMWESIEMNKAGNVAHGLMVEKELKCVLE